MKNKIAIIFILICALLCVPCLVSLAESSSSDTPASSSSSAEAESSESSENSESFESDEEESSSEDEDEKEEKSTSSSKPKKNRSSSEGHRFSGDPIQGETPQFSALELGECDPDDGKDFELKPDKTEGSFEVTIRNTDAEDMKGNDNFFIDFDDCKLWLPIEIPATHVEDDHINSKLIVSYGPVTDSVLGKVTSSVKSSHILQTFSLAMTAYDVKGQPESLNEFDGTIKFEYNVNAACINQYKRDGKLALIFYNTDTRSLEKLDYDLDTEKSVMTVYASNSGSFFIINSENLDLTSSIKLNSHAPAVKVLIYIMTFASVTVSVGLIIYLAVKERKNKKASARKGR